MRAQPPRVRSSRTIQGEKRSDWRISCGFPSRQVGEHSVVLAPFLAREVEKIQDIQVRITVVGVHQSRLAVKPVAVSLQVSEEICLQTAAPNPIVRFLGLLTTGKFIQMSTTASQSSPKSCTSQRSPVSQRKVHGNIVTLTGMCPYHCRSQRTNVDRLKRTHGDCHCAGNRKLISKGDVWGSN